MKYPHTCLALSALAAITTAGLSPAFAQRSAPPVVITPPAVHDGSNFSRAPFPAARPANDVTPPNGEAVDMNLPPNTPATDPETRPLPEPKVAIFQGPRAPAVAEPALLPTGRVTVSAAGPLDATHVATTIASADFTARSQLLTDLDARIKAADDVMKSVRSSMSQMSTGGRSQFQAAQDEVRRTERELRSSMRRARSASQEQWDTARSKLAAAFQAYASALASVDAITGVAPATR